MRWTSQLLILYGDNRIQRCLWYSVNGNIDDSIRLAPTILV
jgi:hypothetical protein